MNHQMQTRKFNCAQTCVAMIADMPIVRAEWLMKRPTRLGPHTGRCHNWQLSPVLHQLGFAVSTWQRVTNRAALPVGNVLLAKVTNGRKFNHFVVISRECLVYDPARPEPMRLELYQRMLKGYNVRFTGYFIVEDRDDRRN